MATQTIEIRSEHPGETNTVCRARNPSTSALVQSKATLAAPDASTVRYFAEFTDLPAGQYLFTHESSTGEVLTYGWATVTLTTATFVLQGLPAAEQSAADEAVAAAVVANIRSNSGGEAH